MLIYSLFYFMFYFTLGSGVLYFSQYFSAIGITGSYSGIIFASGSLLAMIFQPFLGYLNDKTKKSKELLTLMMVVIFISLFIMRYSVSFISLLILYTFYAIAVFSEMPLMDALTLSSEHLFGKIRLWGSIGFAVGGLVTGKVVEVFGPSGFLPLGMIFSTLTIITIIKIPREQNTRDEVEEAIDLRSLLTNKKYILLVLAAILFLGSNNGHNSYFSIYFKDIGGSMTLLGVTVFLMTLSEVPLIAFSTRLVQRKGAEFVVTLAILIVTLRWGFYYFLPKPSLITGSFLLQGASIGFFFGSANLFVKDIVKKSTLSTAIMIFMAAGSLGGMFIQYASGLIIEKGNSIAIYGLFTLLTAIAFLLMFINQKTKKEPLL